ncbi:MAG: carboxypeptidase regulatory-like domain-containing protein [Candidatus Tectomicrobia bacterium]|nr:carboxypeptidase regulatory-like domain-containing protein [Candidatus Tectomicrobia bacterium]
MPLTRTEVSPPSANDLNERRPTRAATTAGLGSDAAPVRVGSPGVNIGAPDHRSGRRLPVQLNSMSFRTSADHLHRNRAAWRGGALLGCRLVAASLLWCMSWSATAAAQGGIASISPKGALQGQTLTVTINATGTNFNSTTSVRFSGEGVGVLSLTVQSATRLSLRVQVEATAPRQNRTVTVTTNSISIPPGSFIIDAAFDVLTALNEYRVDNSGVGSFLLEVVPLARFQPEPAIESVTVDLRQFGVTDLLTLLDNGQGGDRVAGDKTYTTRVTIPAATTEQIFQAPIRVLESVQDSTSTGFARIIVEEASDPFILGITPQGAIPGGSITIRGSGFDRTPANNVVRLGAETLQVSAVTVEESFVLLTALLPATAATGSVTVSRGRKTSNAVSYGVGTASILGTVLATDTGQPLRGATVSLTPLGRSAVSGTSGDYQLLNLPRGTYTLTASLSSFLSAQVENVAVTSAGVQTIDFSLPRVTTAAGGISGRVLNAVSGAALPAITVRAGTASTSTDAQGAFTLTSIPAGGATVSVQAAGFEPFSTTVTVQAGGETALTIRLTPTPTDGGAGERRGRIVGIVLNDLTGAAVPGANVQAGAAATQADAAGAFTLENLPAGELAVAAQADGFTPLTTGVTVQADQETALTIRLTPTPTDGGAGEQRGRIVGVVLNDRNGAAVPGARVQAGAATQTNSAGEFTLGNLPAGELTIAAQADGFTPLTTSVTVQADQETALTIRLTPTGPAPGTPEVTIQPQAVRRQPFTFQFTLADADGVASLDLGTLRVTFNGAEVSEAVRAGIAAQTISQQAISAAATTFSVAGLTLPPGRAAISISVADMEGRVGGAEVRYAITAFPSLAPQVPEVAATPLADGIQMRWGTVGDAPTTFRVYVGQPTAFDSPAFTRSLELEDATEARLGGLAQDQLSFFAVTAQTADAAEGLRIPQAKLVPVPAAQRSSVSAQQARQTALQGLGGLTVTIPANGLPASGTLTLSAMQEQSLPRPLADSFVRLVGGFVYDLNLEGQFLTRLASPAILSRLAAAGDLRSGETVDNLLFLHSLDGAAWQGLATTPPAAIGGEVQAELPTLGFIALVHPLATRQTLSNDGHILALSPTNVTGTAVSRLIEAFGNAFARLRALPFFGAFLPTIAEPPVTVRLVAGAPPGGVVRPLVSLNSGAPAAAYLLGASIIEMPPDAEAASLSSLATRTLFQLLLNRLFAARGEDEVVLAENYVWLRQASALLIENLLEDASNRYRSLLTYRFLNHPPAEWAYSAEGADGALVPERGPALFLMMLDDLARLANHGTAAATPARGVAKRQQLDDSGTAAGEAPGDTAMQAGSEEPPTPAAPAVVRDDGLLLLDAESFSLLAPLLARAAQNADGGVHTLRGSFLSRSALPASIAAALPAEAEGIMGDAEGLLRIAPARLPGAASPLLETLYQNFSPQLAAFDNVQQALILLGITGSPHPLLNDFAEQLWAAGETRELRQVREANDAPLGRTLESLGLFEQPPLSIWAGVAEPNRLLLTPATLRTGLLLTTEPRPARTSRAWLMAPDAQTAAGATLVLVDEANAGLRGSLFGLREASDGTLSAKFLAALSATEPAVAPGIGQAGPLNAAPETYAGAILVLTNPDEAPRTPPRIPQVRLLALSLSALQPSEPAGDQPLTITGSGFISETPAAYRVVFPNGRVVTPDSVNPARSSLIVTPPVEVESGTLHLELFGVPSNHLAFLAATTPLTGVVRGAAGEVLAGATVRLPALEREATTDAEGRYRLALPRALGAANIRLSVEATAAGFLMGEQTVRFTGAPLAVDFELFAEGIEPGTIPLRGTVLDAAFRPIPGATVEVPVLQRVVATDANGAYEFGIPQELGSVNLRIQIIARAPFFETVTQTLTIILEPLTVDFILPISPFSRVLDAARHHLGDDDFSTSVNTGLTLPSEGATYTLSFDLREVISFTGIFRQGTILLNVVGVQLNNPITLNGTLLGAVAQNGDGIAFSFPPTLLRREGNILQITSVSSSSIDFVPNNLDDFEFSNLRLDLR